MRKRKVAVIVIACSVVYAGYQTCSYIQESREAAEKIRTLRSVIDELDEMERRLWEIQQELEDR